MSSATAVRSTRNRSATAPIPGPRAGLRLVTAPQRLRSRAGLVTASLVVLAVGLVVLLVLAVSLQRGAYQMRQLRGDTAELVEQRQALAEEIAALQAPQALAAQARGLGMVPAPNLAVIRRSDGLVLGDATPAKRPPAPRAPVAAKPAVTESAAPTPDKPAGDKPTTDKAAADKPTTEPAAQVEPAAAKPAPVPPAAD